MFFFTLKNYSNDSFFHVKKKEASILKYTYIETRSGGGWVIVIPLGHMLVGCGNTSL